jgi:glutamate-1-semialdehyde 2,1-aminomutase
MLYPGKRLKILNKSEIQKLRAIARGFIENVAKRLLGNRTLWVASKVKRIEVFRVLLGYPPFRKSHYGVQYIDHNIPDRLIAGTIYGARLTLLNTGDTTWRSNPPEGNCVVLVVHSNTKLLSGHKLSRPEIAPGERVTVHLPLKVPSHTGCHTLRLELTEQKVGPFVDRGVPPLALEITIEPGPATQSDEIYQLSSRINSFYYQPTRGIQRSADGRCYPLFASRAKGCRLWDTEDNEYIDYLMGWGSTLLGYADDRIQKAIMEFLYTGAVATLPYPIEMEVSQMLTEDFPSAEMVVFGKNGSDVCTLAARLARAYTKKRVILYCGYHGWQDFWVEQMRFARTGVPERPMPLIHRFRFNDPDDFFRLYEMHKKDLAAVMIEPSGPWAGHEFEGPEPDADPAFLQALARAARKAGALLVFDEIVTGYRYPKGSVQKAKGVVPDLTCLGKALASGMPLSALVGRAHIFQQSFHKTHYVPTFKNEIYSIAAAKAAIGIYREEPVAEYVWNYGEKLREGIHAICAQLGIQAECKGPPFRMALIFQAQDVERLHMKRALYHQELLKEGVTTYNGIMLPSYAHDEPALERTLSAMGNALDVVATADRKNEIDRYLEIPPLL